MAKKEITLEELRSIIREEAIRYKEADAKREALNEERKALEEELKSLNEGTYEECMDENATMEEGQMDELFGMSKKAKAIGTIIDAYQKQYAQQLAQMKQAMDAGNAEAYKAISDELVKAIIPFRKKMVQQLGLKINPNVLHDKMMMVAQPMEPGMVGKSMMQKMAHGSGGSVNTKRAGE